MKSIYISISVLSIFFTGSCNTIGNTAGKIASGISGVTGFLKQTIQPSNSGSNSGFWKIHNLCTPANPSGHPSPMTECDRLASHELDPYKLGQGTTYASLNASVAIPSCEKAVRNHPEDSGRLSYQLGRAYRKEGRSDEALNWYISSAEKDYAMGYVGVGQMMIEEYSKFSSSTTLLKQTVIRCMSAASSRGAEKIAHLELANFHIMVANKIVDDTRNRRYPKPGLRMKLDEAVDSAKIAKQYAQTLDHRTRGIAESTLEDVLLYKEEALERANQIQNNHYYNQGENQNIHDPVDWNKYQNELNCQVGDTVSCMLVD